MLTSMRLVYASIPFVLVLSGCATLFTGDTQIVNIHSNPDNANVQINGTDYSRTPLLANVKKNKVTIVTISKEGYKSTTFRLNSEISPVIMLGIYPGLGLPVTTDLVNGNAYNYVPNYYKINLEKIQK